jgi:hypothetical protein
VILKDKGIPSVTILAKLAQDYDTVNLKQVLPVYVVKEYTWEQYLNTVTCLVTI